MLRLDEPSTRAGIAILGSVAGEVAANPPHDWWSLAIVVLQALIGVHQVARHEFPDNPH